MSIKDQVDAVADANEGTAPKALTYSELRLREISIAAERIAFWVSLWSVLAVVAVGLTLLGVIIAAINNS